MKKIITTTIAAFCLSFGILGLYILCEEVMYYSSYTREDLATFFTLSNVIKFNVTKVIRTCTYELIGIVPTAVLLSKTKLCGWIRALATTMVGIAFLILTFFIFLQDGMVSYGRISGIQKDVFFVQVVGKCGATQLTESELYETEEEAKKAMEKERPLVNFL